jgi:DNA-binding NarL/FixJ family response regulator
VVRELRALLEPEFDVVGTVADGRALVAMVEDLKPDVVVSDVALPLLDGVAAVRQFRLTDSKVAVVFVTVLTEPEVRQHALAAGAVVFLSKASAGDELLPAVRAAIARKSEPASGKPM